MTKFEPVALRAVLGQLPAGAQPADFTDWNRVSDLLNALTPEQRCDAVYAEWLHQLQSSSGQILLSVRNDLISHGALAANYLAELAQNADDASDGQPAEIRIVFAGEWLLVANNGRKITPKNLLGLCRFFVHFGREAVRLDKETIGRFGIGFKSSYRIASEVFVETWDSVERFAFRLPICHPSRPDSHPEPTRLAWIREHLRRAGSNISEETCQVEHLGLCTPEFVDRLPDAIRDKAKELQAPKRGSVFCFHLHEEGQHEVAGRITGEAGKVYELCPLFLPNLGFVQRGEAELTRELEGLDVADGLPGAVEGRKVTLTTSLPGQRKANACFWRLRGLADQDKWQIALHTDSKFQLSVASAAGKEEETSVKEGAAYAFFPLNAVNSAWPLLLHLHLDLPTELSRGDWNHESAADRETVETQIRRSIAGLAKWLEQHPDKRHADWRLEDLVKRVPENNELWARAVWEALQRESKSRRVLRALDGAFVAAEGAASVELLDKEEARRAWAELLAACPGQPVLESRPPARFGVQSLNPDEIADRLVGVADWSNATGELRMSLLHATLACCRTTTPMLERVLGRVPVELASGGTVSIRELFQQPGGAELTPAWHTTFRRLASWATEAPWRYASVFHDGLERQLRKLAEPEFNPTWVELPERLGNLQAWQQRGADFWRNPRRLACPPAHRASTLASLFLPNGPSGWLPLNGLWLADDTSVDCFAGLLTSWPLVYQALERQRITGFLSEWGLFAEWEQATKKVVTEKLPGILARRLAEQANGDAFAVVFGQGFEDARRLLDGDWAHIVSEAEKRAVSLFVQAQSNEENLSGKTVLSVGISATVRAALRLDAGFVLAPSWLTNAAHQRICRLGLQEHLGFKFLSQQEFSKQRETLIRELLEHFHHWKDSAPTPDALAGLNEMAAITSRANRRNWPLGLSSQKKPLLKELIHAQSSEADANLAEQLNRLLLQKVDWRNAEPLPALLAQVPSVAEVCVQPHKLQLEVPDVPLTPIEFSQIPSTALEEPAVRALVEAGKHHFFTSTRALKLRWLQDGEVVATLPAADYAVDGDKLIFAHSLPPADEEQFRDVLAIYQRYDVTSAAYRRDQEAGLAGFSLYQNHRDQITKVLIEKEVRAVGYGEQHVLRELLQNAESAYASKANPPPEPWFRFIVERPEQGNICKVSVSHIGRAFNEPDKDGKERPDVERIVKVNAPNQNTEDEVGRFNKGFKCVFSVARDQRVRIHSGGFDFEVQDLLLRVPANPERNLNDQNPETQFMFDADFKDVLAMLSFKEMPKSNSLLSVLNASSFVFLRHLRRVMVKFAEREWTWTITRQPETNGWERVTVDAGAGRVAEVFLVRHDRLDGAAGRCHAVAVRLGKDGLPSKLDADWRSLRLTFETDEKLNLDVLVNGQFDAEQGRRKLVNVAGSGLVDAAFQAAVARCEAELTGENSKARWLAWARVLNLGEGLKALKDRVSSFEILSQRVERFFTTRIPHEGATKSMEQLVFPTGLMRELLKANYASRWGILFADWIDAEVEKELPSAERTKFSLPKWLGRQTPLAPKLHEIQRDLGTNQFRMLTERFTQPQKEEFAEAQRILTEKLRLTAPVIGHSLPVAAWTATQLWSWWKKESEPARLYTLDGDSNWPLLFPNDSTPKARRSEKLRTTLAQPEGEGREVWYRLLSLACLLSAQGRTETLRNFWLEKLEAGGFWNATALIKCDFANLTRELFGNLVLQRHSDGAATGEWADYWRRVFYDVRKVHELVWHHNFAETIVQLALDSRRSGDLTLFLRGGQLAGQPAWAGVLGQSSGAPLFFVARELCRLNLAGSPDLKRLAFFPCTPVRRAALSIGWLQPPLARATDFKSLAKVSEQLHQRVQGHPELAKLFDIPLLHMGLTCDSLPPAHAAD